MERQQQTNLIPSYNKIATMETTKHTSDYLDETILGKRLATEDVQPAAKKARRGDPETLVQNEGPIIEQNEHAVEDSDSEDEEAPYIDALTKYPSVLDVDTPRRLIDHTTSKVTLEALFRGNNWLSGCPLKKDDYFRVPVAGAGKYKFLKVSKLLIM